MWPQAISFSEHQTIKVAPKKEIAKSTYPMDHLACSTVLVANKSLKKVHVTQKYCNKEPILDEIKSPNITIAPDRAFIIDVNFVY